MIWIQTGFLSGGKTVTHVKNVIESGKRIITNFNFNPNLISFNTLTDEQFISWMLDIMKIKEEEKKQILIEQKFKDVSWFVDEAEFLFDARKFGSKIADVGTAFIRQLGKLDVDAYLTCHIEDSDIDKRVRGLAQIFGVSTRIDYVGREIIMSPRIVDYKVLIKNDIEIKTSYGFERGSYVFDPEEYYKYYNTRKIILWSRDNFK